MQMSTLHNKSFDSEHAPPTQAIPLRMTSGAPNIPQRKASADQDVCKHQKATFEVVKGFLEAIIFTKTPGPIISDVKYLMVEEACSLAIEPQDHQRALAGTPVGTPSVCQLPGRASVEIDLQPWESVSPEFCAMLLNHSSDIDYVPKYT